MEVVNLNASQATALEEFDARVLGVPKGFFWGMTREAPLTLCISQRLVR